MRQAKKSKYWTFHFPCTTEESVNDSDGKPIARENVAVKTAYVVSNYPNEMKELRSHEGQHGNEIVLCYEEAGLLAITVFCKLIDSQFAEKLKITLPPLAAAVFMENGVEQIALKLNKDPYEVAKIITCSAQGEGHLLPDSSLDCAFVCFVFSTRNMKDSKHRLDFIKMKTKQYLNAGKSFNFDIMKIYAGHSIGLIAHQLSEIGLEMFNELHC